MSKANLFLDSSALFAGIVPSTGAARAMPHLPESEPIPISLSEQVAAETERAISHKVPQAFADFTGCDLSLEGANYSGSCPGRSAGESSPDLPSSRCADLVVSYQSQHRIPGHAQPGTFYR